MADAKQWHGHRLTPLPPGERWLVGNARSPQPPAAATGPQREDDRDDPWLFGLTDRDITVAPAPAARAAASPARGSWRGPAALVVLGLAALLTIFLAHRTGPASEPAPLPEAPSSVITSLSRTAAQQVTVHVGDYIRFELPGGRTYSAVIEQSGIPTPVLESLDLPGQQPQLRADSAGHAYLEVMQEPTCSDPDACPDRRTLVGGVSVTVTP